MMSLQLKLIPPPSQSAWSQGEPRCRQVRVQLAVQGVNHQPMEKASRDGSASHLSYCTAAASPSLPPPQAVSWKEPQLIIIMPPT